MNLLNLLTGLSILSKYFISMQDNGYYLGLNSIFIGPTDYPVTGEDVKLLKSLGWVQDHWGEELSTEVYDQSEQWVAS